MNNRKNKMNVLSTFKEFKLSNSYVIYGGTQTSNNYSDDSLQANDNFIIGPYFAALH